MCIACTGTASNCSSCKAVSDTNYFLQPIGLLCLSTCPTGFYGNASTFACSMCDSRCSACTGPTNGTCTGCKVDSSGVAHFLAPGTGPRSCSNACPDSLYANTTTFKCEACDSNCLKCFNSSTNCTLCKPITQSAQIYLQNFTCVDKCGSSYFRFGFTCINVCPNGTKE